MSDLIGKLVADKYRVESLIREEDLGDLFAGRHEVLDKPVTLKILPHALSIDQRWSKRFIDEARAASAVKHQNVLELIDFGSDARGTTYAVFEQIAGETLRDQLSGEPVTESRALAIGRSIADAVAAAHEKDVLHCHLEPRNVFVATDENGVDTVKVIGFGADRMTVARDADPRYLAPEQCNAFPSANERSDVYAVGVMLYEMLTGTVPFEGKTPTEILDRVHGEPPPPMSAFRRDLHPDIEPIILTAMAVNPEKRYQSMAAFAEDLAMVSGTPAAAAAAAGGEGKKHNVWQTAFIALAGILILATALIYATYSRRSDPTAKLEVDPASMPVQPIGPATGAQEENLAKLPEMTEAEIMAAQNSNMMANPIDQLPGGDGYNPWAGGTAPPAGAPPAQYIPPGGQTVTIDPNGGSPFMPQDSGTILYTKDPSGRCLRIPSYEPFPCPPDSAVVKPTPRSEATPKTTAGNASTTGANTTAAPTPKQMATPPPRNPAANRPAANAKPAPTKPGEENPEKN